MFLRSCKGSGLRAPQRQKSLLAALTPPAGLLALLYTGIVVLQINRPIS